MCGVFAISQWAAMRVHCSISLLHKWDYIYILIYIYACIYVYIYIYIHIYTYIELSVAAVRQVCLPEGHRTSKTVLVRSSQQVVYFGRTGCRKGIGHQRQIGESFSSVLAKSVGATIFFEQPLDVSLYRGYSKVRTRTAPRVVLCS